MRKFAQIVCLVMALGASLLHACLWDRDTLAQESARFPGVLEIMSGNFPRHSKEFYAWRRDACIASLAKDPNQLALYDDLAVAHHKLGDQNSAIAVMMEKEKRQSGLYETYSNLGTFYIYAGDLQSSLKYLDKALAINVNAHFGREKYQKWLVEWILDGQTTTYATFVAKKQVVGGAGGSLDNPPFTADQRQAAMNGVLGMMLFADFDNPFLQEALGDLLLAPVVEEKETHHMDHGMAYGAYAIALLKVSRDNREHLQAKAHRLTSNDYIKLGDSMKAGENLIKLVRLDEMMWIASGVDANAEYNKKYLKARKS